MDIPLEQVWAALDSLLDYAQQRELLCDDDRIYARNLLLGDLGLEQYVPPVSYTHLHGLPYRVVQGA